MTLTTPEVAGILIVAVAAAALALRLAWEFLRPSSVPERWAPDEPISMEELGALQAEINSAQQERRMAAKVAGLDQMLTIHSAAMTRTIPSRPIMANYVSGAFAFPARVEFYDQERSRG